MQALFYIGLFGTFFFVMSSITAGVARTTFQQQLDREDRVVQVFNDIEYAINRVMLRDQLSLANEDIGNMNYILPHLSWSSEDVATDPWARPVTAARIDERQVIAAFAPGERAEAIVSHFALISGGPDREIQTDIPASVEEWRILHSAGGAGDDIVHTFSTRDPMMETWNAAAEVEKTIDDILERSYRQRVEQYSPTSGSADDNVVGVFTNCALLNQTGNLNGYNCAQFSAQLINECNTMHQYNLAVDAGEQMQRPQTQVLPRDVDVQLGQCWRYDDGLKADVDFPTMAGAPIGGARNCAGNNDCTIDPRNVGVWSEMQRDPFGGFRLAYDDDFPDQLTLQRNLALDGWFVVRNNDVRSD